jgi:hypothetical protein
MNRRQALAGISAMTASLALTPSRSFAMISIETVSKDRAKELGLEVRANGAGPDAVRFELAFETKALPRYSRVDLEIRDGGKLLSSSTLWEEPAKPGRVIISFAADRAKLGQFTLRVVTGGGTRNMIGYDIPVKEFVDLDKLR